MRRPQLADEVAAHIRGIIMSGAVRPGDFLRLDQIAEDLEVSVTPVREALQALRGEDLVSLEPRRGYRVAPISRQDVEDLFWMQGNLAGELATRAARQMTPECLTELTAIQSKLADAAGRGQVDEVEALEHDFHRVINRQAGARKLAWFLRNAMHYTPHRFYSSDAGWREQMIADHAAILTALRSGSAEAARDAMTRHFTDGAGRLIPFLEKAGIWE